MKGKCLLPVLLAMMATTACLQDPEAPMNQPELPTLTVDETSLTRVSMVVNGTLGKNMEDVTGIGVEISETLFEDGGTYKSYEPQEVNAGGFSLGVTDLTSNSTYFLRAYITNGYSKLYSSTITQKTPESSVASISDVTIKDNYYLVATIEDNGGRSVEDVGFLWSTSSERKDIKREKRYVGTLSADGKTFTLPLSEVGEGTHYILAYAEDDKDGTGYSRIPFEYSLKGEDEAQIEDPNFKKYLLLYHDANEDGKFTYAELKQVEFIDVHTDNIKSVREIDQMPLKSLLVNGTQARSGQLTSLNVSKNTALLSIDCSNNNLKELDASMIPGLEYLNCEGNPMETLYLSYYQKFNELLYPEGCKIVYVDAPAGQPNNEIWYTSADGKVVEPTDATGFGAQIVSNTYSDGKGIILFDGDVTAVGDAAFRECNQLTAIWLPSTVTRIGQYAFQWCDNLEKVDIPDAVTIIGKGAFIQSSSMSKLRDVELPQSLLILEDGAFGGTGIISVTIPDGLTTLGVGVFVSCASLERFSGKYASSDGRCLIVDNTLCAFAPAGLTSYEVQNGVEGITDYAFEMCQELTSLTIPEGVKDIGVWAFGYCHRLTTFHIPSTVTSIEYGAFSYCSSLESFTGKYTSEDNRCLIIEDSMKEKRLVAFASAGLTDYSVPDGVTIIGQDSFRGIFTQIDAVYLPESVERIENNAFTLAHLRTIRATNLKEIGAEAFYRCLLLTSVSLPASMMSIGDNAFAGCTNLAQFEVLAETPPTLGTSVFSEDNNLTIYVPSTSLVSYKNSWSAYADRIQPMSQPGSIIYYTSTDGNVVDPYKPDAFNTTVISNTYEDGIGKLVFDGPLTKIGNAAFFNSPLLEITLPDSVEEIAENAFWQEPAHWTLQAFYGKGASEDHLSLVSNGVLVAVARKDEIMDFVIPENVTKVGWNVFYSCKYRTVTIPAGLKSCDNGFPSMSDLEAFYGPNVSEDHRCFILNGVIMAFAAKGLTSYTLTESLDGIGSHAFYNQYSSLKELVLPDTATSIGTCAFSLTPITSLTLPAHLKSIATEAFFAMYSLPRITIPAEVETIGSEAFSYAGDNYGGLTDITFLSTTPPVIKEDTFVNLIGDGPFYVPAQSVQAYKTAQYWSAYADRIQPIPSDISASKYLTFTSEGITKLSLTNNGDNAPVLYYSTDAQNWIQWDYSELTFTAGAPLYMCGDNPDGFSMSSEQYSSFATAGDMFSVNGSIMSLMDKDNDMMAVPAWCFYSLFYECSEITTPPELPATYLAGSCYLYMFMRCTNLLTAPSLPAIQLSEFCYANMFEQCTHLKTAPVLPATELSNSSYSRMFAGCTSLTSAPVLPATKLADYCYIAMFEGCSQLTTAPELPATSLALSCYYSMFRSCTSLINAPELPAVSLAENCYTSMFSGCTALTTAPVLSAPTLVSNCYGYMFYDCSSLNYLKCLSVDISAENCASYWLFGVSSKGTFVKSAQMNDWPTGTSGIPEGWTVINDGDTPSGGNEGTGEEPWN